MGTGKQLKRFFQTGVIIGIALGLFLLLIGKVFL